MIFRELFQNSNMPVYCRAGRTQTVYVGLVSVAIGCVQRAGMMHFVKDAQRGHRAERSDHIQCNPTQPEPTIPNPSTH